MATNPQAFSMNDQNQYFDPINRAWRDAHEGQGYVDTVKQGYANQLAGLGGGWSAQTGWDGGKAAIPTDWSNAYQDFWSPKKNYDKYASAGITQSQGNPNQYVDGSARNPSVVGNYRQYPGSVVGLSGLTRQINDQGQILGDGGQQMRDGAGNLLSYRSDGVYNQNGQRVYGINGGQVTNLPASNPQSIVGLSGVTRQIGANGQILGDNGQVMKDGSGNELMYRSDGVYSPSGQKLYGINNGRVVNLPQGGSPQVGGEASGDIDFNKWLNGTGEAISTLPHIDPRTGGKPYMGGGQSGMGGLFGRTNPFSFNPGGYGGGFGGGYGGMGYGMQPGRGVGNQYSGGFGGGFGSFQMNPFFQSYWGNQPR